MNGGRRWRIVKKRSIGYRSSGSKERGGTGNRRSRQRNRQNERSNRIRGDRREGDSWAKISCRGMDSALEEAKRRVVCSSGKDRSGRRKRKNGDGGRWRRTAEASSVLARSDGGIEGDVLRQSKSSGGAVDGKVAVKSATVHVIGAERDDGVEFTKHGKAKNSVDSDIRAKSKRDRDGGAGLVDVGSIIADNSGEVAMVDAIKISGVANSTAKFDGLERVGVVELDEFRY